MGCDPKWEFNLPKIFLEILLLSGRGGIHFAESMPIKKIKLGKISKYHKLKVKCVVCFYSFSGAFENI